MKDRYLGVDDPRPDPGAPPAQPSEPAAGIEEPSPAAETPHPARFEGEARGYVDEEPPPAAETPKAEPPRESDVDRSVRVTREVLLGRPGPHSLEAAAVEIERRLREGPKA